MITARTRFSWLTDRERAVLRALLDGQSCEEIAKAHYVSVCTIRTQIRFILMKLGVNSQVQAVALAHREMFNEDERAEAFERLLAS